MNYRILKLETAFWASIFAALLALDFFTKNLAERFLTEPMELIPGVLRLALSKNPGVAFSIPLPNALMLWLTPLLIGVLTYFFAKSCDISKRLARLCCVLLLAGALGNYIDRLFSGAVTDFIDFSFWPSFNLADSYLTIGVFLMVAFYGRMKREN